MAVKDELKALLEEHRREFLSGAEIAESLGCTRGAVWKAVESLRSEGYKINAVTNKGYCLEDTDILSEESIRAYLGKTEGLDITVYRSTDSTNIRLRELAEKGAPEGTVVIAGAQTGGKGRLGRKFFSPEDTGLYLSILIRPDMTAENAVRITTAAAVAVAEAAEEISGRQADIKWVNDVYMDGLKICGILTEASFTPESGGLEYAVVGIGINVYEPEGGFPDELKNIAGAVMKKRSENDRSRMAARVISGFMKYYRTLTENTFLESYRSRLIWKGEKINLISGNMITPATLIDVDEKCRLLVELENGEHKTISSGEISIRKQK